jgi:23S rRNA (guanine2535-N1)-methyltransferase
MDPIQALFDNAYSAINNSCSIVAVIADKNQKLQHERFKRIQYFKIGKRQIAFFEPLPQQLDGS